jgi:hypothetical protein
VCTFRFYLEVIVNENNIFIYVGKFFESTSIIIFKAYRYRSFLKYHLTFISKLIYLAELFFLKFVIDL